MNHLKAPISKLRSICLSESYSGKSIDFDVLNLMGCFILREAIGIDTIEFYTRAYYAGLEENSILASPDHLTEMKFDTSQTLNSFVEERAFIDLAKQFFSGNVGMDYIRLVRKNFSNTKPVFLHQDSPYQIGSFDGYSFFVALTSCDYNNGALILYPGTHNYGYLGDAGEIARVLPYDYPSIETATQPGDVLIMHSATWHESPENLSLTDRVYLEIHIQHADAASTRKVIFGERQTEWVNHLSVDEIFLSSRKQRLKSLYKKLNEK